MSNKERTDKMYICYRNGIITKTEYNIKLALTQIENNYYR